MADDQPRDLGTRCSGAALPPSERLHQNEHQAWLFLGLAVTIRWGVKMGSRRRRIDPVGPFGNPDGARADIEDVISEFVDFGGNPAYGHLATHANDSMVRVIVGKLGAGKTVYLRRLQDFQAHQDSVYADVPQQSLPKTEVIVKACQWFSDRVLVEKWMQIWERAITRSLASHLLRNRELRQQLRDEEAEELEQSYARLLDDFRRPRAIYGQMRDIINQRQTAHQLSTYLDDPLWDDLEDLLGEILGHCKPIYFYLDAVDEEFSHAPMYWLKCQEGLFLSGHATAPRPEAGRAPACRHLHPRHRHVVGVPVRTCATVLQRAAYTRPDLGSRLAALSARAKAAPAAAVTADATRHQWLPHDPRLARDQRRLGGTPTGMKQSRTTCSATQG